MKKSRYNLTKRLIAAVTSLVLVLALTPRGMQAAVAVEADHGTLGSYEELMNPTIQPEEFTDEANLHVNPYGYKLYENFTISPDQELLYYYSFSKDTSTRVFSELVLDDFDGNTTDREFSQLGKGGNSPFRKTEHNYTNLNGDLKFVQAVAFDPTGSGRNDHVAYIGLNPYYVYGNNDRGAVGVFIMNVNTGESTSVKYIGAASVMAQQLKQHQASNFLAITAGHYDSAYDGETLVTYCALDNNKSCLIEWLVGYNNGKLGFEMIDSATTASGNSYLHAYYGWTKHEGDELAKSDKIYNHLSVSLATGDFNNDLIDDLAVLSYVNDIHCKDIGDNAQKVNAKFFAPYLTVVKGDTGGILNKNKNTAGDYVRYSEKKNEYISMTAPSVAAGDVNGDGSDEIVVAGWKTDLKLAENGLNRDDYDVNDGATVGIYGFKKNGLEKLMLKAYTDVGENGNVVDSWAHKSKTECDNAFNDSGEGSVMPQFAVECVALDGVSNPEYVFLNGNFRRYNTSSSELDHKYTPSDFKDQDSDCDGMSVALGFISSMAVGVFDGNLVGREQIVLSVGLWDNGVGENEDDYSYMLGMMGGREYKDTASSYGTLGKYYTTAFDHGDGAFGYKPYDYDNGDMMEFHNTGFNDWNRANCVVVAVDSGNDGLIGQYVGKELVYSEPNVLGFLQASPYFEELGYYGGETEYTVGTTYTMGQTETKTTSFSVGFSTEVEAPGIRVAVGAGYAREWSESFDEYYSVSHSMTFKSGAQNKVILQRTPIIVYRYKIDGGGEIQVSVPSDPVYTSLSTDDYNQFVENYDFNVPEAKLKKIETWDQRLYKNEGHPEFYFSEYNTYRTRLSEDISTGTGAGVNQATFDRTDGTTESNETSNGYYVDASVGTGASFLLGSVYAGVDTSVSGSVARGYYTTTEEFSSVSGSVADPDCAISEDIPAGICNQFSFTWSLATWDAELFANSGRTIPVYGYVVKSGSIRRAVAAPENLKSTKGTEADLVELTWDAVSDARSYSLYLVNEEGEYTRVADSIRENRYTYRIPENNASGMCTFAVTVTKTTDFFPNGVESLYSNKTYYYRTAYGLSAYDLARENGFDGTLEEWLLSLVGAPGKDGADGADGVDGKDGVGIADIYLDAETNYLTVKLTNGDVLTLGDISGEDGNGVASVGLNAAGELVIRMDDGYEYNMGVIRGADGKDGEDGLTPYIPHNGNNCKC